MEDFQAILDLVMGYVVEYGNAIRSNYRLINWSLDH